jgi:hypothetical protein
MEGREKTRRKKTGKERGKDNMRKGNTVHQHSILTAGISQTQRAGERVENQREYQDRQLEAKVLVGLIGGV